MNLVVSPVTTSHFSQQVISTAQTTTDKKAPLSATAETQPTSSSDQAFTEQELKEIQELKARDREVKAHEAAHLAAAGSLAIGGANYTYQRGPDGVQYAVGGEVNIDTSAVEGDPEATLQKAERIRSAALAPAQPSTQDRQVAAQAAQLAIQARAEISQQQDESASNSYNNDKTRPTDQYKEALSTPLTDDTNSTVLDLIA